MNLRNRVSVHRSEGGCKMDAFESETQTACSAGCWHLKENYFYENPDDLFVCCGNRVDGCADRQYARSGRELFEPGFHHRSGEGEEASQKVEEGRCSGKRHYERRPGNPGSSCKEVILEPVNRSGWI